MRAPKRTVHATLKLFCVFSTCACVACGITQDDKDTGTDPGPAVEEASTALLGTVLGAATDTNPVDIAGALVDLPKLGLATTTDANGRFEMRDVPAGEHVLHVRAEGYGEACRLVHVREKHTTPVQTVLKALAAARVVTLPAAGEPPLQLQEGAMTLQIEAGDLALPDGTVATGTARLQVTYYHPDDDADAFPADLTGIAGPDRLAMTTFGMLRVEASQESAPLNVSEGATVTWSTVVPDSRVDRARDLPPESLWLDFDRGVWVPEAESSYDANTGIMTAELPHFSYWNADAVFCIAFDEASEARGRLYGDEGLCPTTEAECTQLQTDYPDFYALAYEGKCPTTQAACDADFDYRMTSTCAVARASTTTCANVKAVDLNDHPIEDYDVRCDDGATADGVCFVHACTTADGSASIDGYSMHYTVQALLMTENVEGKSVKTATASYTPKCSPTLGGCETGNCDTFVVHMDGYVCWPEGFRCWDTAECCGAEGLTHECADEICVPTGEQ